MALGRSRGRRWTTGRRSRGGSHGTATAALLVLLTLAATACGTSVSSEPVRVANGVIQGVDDGDTRQFLGIRYAEPPVGPRRWAPPVPAGPWDGTLEATEPGPTCPQVSADGDAGQDEDCLFLNVTTPRDVRPGERLPVFVWWHGGGFATGSGAEYGAGRLADQGRLAVVTPNYRLGVLGYLGLPGLAGSGAFGFADQIESLRWTRENIAAFGGDPDNITVAGESAGGAAACALLTSPALTELAVKHVIVMSGACSTDMPANGLVLRSPPRGLYASTPDVEATGRRIAAALGCPPPGSLECLRDKPADALLRQNPNLTGLAWGGDLLPADPTSAVRTAVPPWVPVMYGGTHDEARSFFKRTAQVNPATRAPAFYDRLLDEGFGPAAARVRQQYPVERYGGNAMLAWSAVISDVGWACANLRDQRTLAARGPTYAYEFARPDGPAGPEGFPTGGALHGTELPLLFDRAGQRPAPGEEDLSRLVIAYWSSFARTGTPESPNGPTWSPVPAGGPVTPLQFDPTSVRPVDTGADHRCDFWASIR